MSLSSKERMLGGVSFLPRRGRTPNAFVRRLFAVALSPRRLE
jgi:hypothetical protein